MTERTHDEDLLVPLDDGAPPPARHTDDGGAPSRATTVVWGVLLLAMGALATLVGLGVAFDPVLALVGVLVLAAVGLLVSALRPPRR